MRRMRRMLAVLLTVLLVAGAFASPVLAQTAAEEDQPYPVEVLPDADEAEVLPEADELDEPAAEEPAAVVAGVVLQRTGAGSLLLGAIGLLFIGLGVLVVMRTRRGVTEA